MNSFKISQGDLPTITDTLTDETGLAVDLSSATLVQFIFQALGSAATIKTATVTDASNGKVSYQFVAGETAVLGLYSAQWKVTDNAGGLRSFPTCPFSYEVESALPQTLPDGNFTKLSDLYDDVRALTGDFKKRLYQDSAIASVMRTQLRLGRVKDGCNRWTVLPDGQTISPSILNTDIQPYSLLVYHTALTLVTPNLAGYSYRTRALSERFGEQKDFLAEMKNVIYELEDGEQAYATISGLRASLFAVNGIFVWSYLQMENNVNLSYH